MNPNTKNMTSSSTGNETSAPPGCLVLHVQGLQPWDDPENMISAETEDLVRRWKNAVVLPILFLIGGPANVINMAVFHKQGLTERVNVCFFALSLADFLFLFQVFLLNCEAVPFDHEESYGPFAKFFINSNLTGLYGFYWVSQILSAIIASDRLYCILYPLRSHSLLSPSTTTIIIVVINIVTVGVYFFVSTRYRILCVYNPAEDTTSNNIVPGEFYLMHQEIIDYVDVFVYDIGIPVVGILVVMITTILTMMKLRTAAAWRVEMSSCVGLSSKELALTRMLVANSLFFVVCIFPNVMFRFVWLSLPEVNIGRSQHNLFMVALWMLDMISWTNCSFNIVVYYLMGSRYRQTLWELVGRKLERTAS